MVLHPIPEYGFLEQNNLKKINALKCLWNRYSYNTTDVSLHIHMRVQVCVCVCVFILD
jgi:hypothetical protein